MGDAVLPGVRREQGLDLLTLPVLGPILRSRRGKRVLQTIVLAIAVLMIVDGFFGPRLAPRNLATLFGWVHYRGLLVLVLLAAGNFFCMTCPFTLSRDIARKFFKPIRNWPHRLRNKWVAIALFVAILFCYELFDLWGSPTWTAAVILAYFVGAVVVDSVFRNASFCKYVCPIGQFNFVSSTVSPLEVRVRDPQVCLSCQTLDCIRGTRDQNEPEIVIQRGCELALFQPKKVGNLDCTFCLDCVYACPHDNVGVLSRLPAAELGVDDRRSGIGRLSRRNDYSILALVFTFGALLNAFAMVSPVYAAEQWLAGVLGTTHELPVLATIFALALVAEPALLVGGAAAVSRAASGGEQSLWQIIRTYSFGLIPLGVGIWAAHYAFHLLTGLWTFIPVVQRIAAEILSRPTPRTTMLVPGLPEEIVYPIEIGLIGLGLLGSLLALYQIASRERPNRTRPAYLPWAVLSMALAGAAVWLLSQPMEMRGTFLGG